MRIHMLNYIQLTTVYIKRVLLTKHRYSKDTLSPQTIGGFLSHKLYCVNSPWEQGTCSREVGTDENIIAKRIPKLWL